MEKQFPAIVPEDFHKAELRIGTILSAKALEKARKPAYILEIDFGTAGIKKSSARITSLYQPQDLVGKQVIAVLNFPPRQIATIMSECLVLGGLGDQDEVTLLVPERPVANGTLIG